MLEVDGNDTIEGSLDADDEAETTKEDEQGLELLGGTTSRRSMGGVGGGVGASESGMSRSSSSFDRCLKAAGARILYTNVSLPPVLELAASPQPNPIKSSAFRGNG